MRLGPRPLRAGLAIVVVATAYAIRPATMPPRVFYALILCALIIANLALWCGQEMRRKRFGDAPGTRGAATPRQRASPVAPKKTPWLLVVLGFVSATGLGIGMAHETGIWLFIPVGLLLGCSYDYFVLKKLR